MKRRRSSAPGRLRPDGRWIQPILLAAFVAVLTAACGQATSTGSPMDTPPASSDAAPTDAATPGPSAGGPTGEPSVSAEPGTHPPTANGSTGPSADPSGGIGSAAACSGSDENRDFFASMAAAVDWTVYCPILPDAWFVEDGQYRLANGGWMEISYDGPGDARVELRQGALGDAAGGCFPPGPRIDDAVFGDQAGVIVDVASGGWAVVVDRGEPICWMILATGLDESSTRAVAADLHAVVD